MKYEFIKVDDDITKLKYKDKEFEIKKDIGLLQKLQSLNSKARILMMNDLKKEGMTTNDLVVVKKEGNKTFEDKSSLIELEEYYTGVASQTLYDEILKEATGMNLAELLVDMDLDYTNKATLEVFMTELTKSISVSGKTPSQEN